MDQRAHVLLVEDNSEGREPLCAVLELDGYRVTSANTGRAALALLDADRVDTVVLDLGLPDMDGVEIIRAVRSRPDPPAVLVFSGHHRLREIPEVAACDGFILKPDLGGLLARLKSIVEDRRASAPPRSSKRA
jgi:two-component system KDP operon response regulator KdpE